MRIIGIRQVADCLVMLAVVGVGRDAVADAIDSYTYTNLGPNTSFSTDSAGNRVVVSSDGQSYSFPATTNQSWTPGALAQMGVPTLPYDSNPKNQDYATAQSFGGLSNQNGYFVGIFDTYPQYTDEHYNPDNIYTFKKQPDGSFSPATVLYTQFNDFGTFGGRATLLGISNNNLALAQVQSNDYLGDYNKYLLINLDTGKLFAFPTSYNQTILSSNPSTETYLFLQEALAIDAQGRLLFRGISSVGNNSQYVTLLLTPPGLSSSPIPTPEPTALLTLGVLSIGLLIRRNRPR